VIYSHKNGQPPAGAKVGLCRTVVLRERKFPRTKGPGNESSWNFRSWGTKVLHRDLLFLGTKGLVYEKSVIPQLVPGIYMCPMV